ALTTLFFFTDAATPASYTLSLHDALPISVPADRLPTEAFYHPKAGGNVPGRSYTFAAGILDDVWSFDPAVFGISPREAAQMDPRSEEHTSELQSQSNLVCRLLLEKKKKTK